MTSDSFDTRLLDGLNHLICALDTEGNFTYVNGYWKEVLGWNSPEMLNKSFTFFIHPEDKEQTVNYLNQMTNVVGKEVKFHNRFLTRQGDYRLLEWNIRHDSKSGLLGEAKDTTQKASLLNSMQENNAQLSQAEKMAKVGHWRVDLLEQTLTWSDEVYRIHGVDKTTFTPQVETAINFYHPEDRDKVRACLEEALRTGRNYEFCLRIVRPDGEVRKVISHGEISVDSDNTPTSIFGVFQDVTEHEHLISQHSLLSLVANTTTTGVVITDPDRKVIWVNEAFSEMSGYSLAEVTGQQLGPFLQGPETNPDTVRQIKASLDRGDNVDIEILNYQKSGESYWNHLLISPEYQDGELLHFIGLQHDITPRKKAEMGLIKEEEKYRDVVNNAREVIFQLDRNGVCTFVNPFWSHLTGYQTSEVLGSGLIEYIGLEHREIIAGYLKKSTQGLYSHFNGEVEFHDKFGNTKFVDMRLIPTFSGTRKHTGFQGTIVDKTEFREQQLILARTQRIDAMGEMVAGICHDFNNLLGIVRGNSDLLDMSVQDVEVRPFIDHIRKASEHGSVLTEKLLLSTKKMSSIATDVDLTETIEELIPIIKGSLPNDVYVTTDIKPGLACHTNVSELQNSLINLVINAKNAMSEGGEIHVEVKTTAKFNPDREYAVSQPKDVERYICLSVEDNGSGISPEIIEDIFKPFFTTRKGLGSGLGLSMVAGFATRFEYGLTLTSEVGKGTRFSLWFPELDEQPVFIEENGTRVVGKVPDNIVIIDDEEMLLEAIVAYMEQENVTATAFSDPEVAMNYIRMNSAHIDVIITDEIMPGRIHGHDIVEYVQSLDCDIKTVLMTGYASVEALDMINCPIIFKPFSMNQLKKVILEA